MSRTTTLGAIAGGLLAALGACTAPPSATDLYPHGPPKIRQVMMSEEYLDTQGTLRTRGNALAFGHHDDPAFATDDGKVDTAVADDTQVIRVVMDELLVGNNLEMVQCAAPVDLTVPKLAQSFSRVPLGTTPDQIARCSGPEDLLLQTCTGEHAVCLNGTGAVQITASGDAVQPGNPVGILDTSPNDGVPDHDLFIDGSVKIMCQGASGPVEAKLDLTASYWQPSGNQQVPANGGVAELGPALVLHPLQGLPTGTRCSVVFDKSVVDKGGDPVCASPGGDPTQDCPAPGDTHLVDFGVAKLRIENYQPQTATVPTTKLITLKFNTAMSETSLATDVVVTANGLPQPLTIFNETDNAGNPTLVYDIVPNGRFTLDAATAYVVTVKSTVKDFAGQPIGGNDFTYSFMTN